MATRKVARRPRERQFGTLTLGLTAPPVLREGFPVTHQHALAIDLARVGPIGPAEIAKIRRDGEIIVSHLREHPKEMTALFNHIAAGRQEEAKALARKIGFTEEDFQQESGGMWFYIAFVGVIIGGCVAFGC